jgi:hypothetical protein
VIQQQLSLENKTLAEHLKVAGYATACVGKWHLGGKDFLPTDQGFDLYRPGKVTTKPSETEGGKGEYELTAWAEEFIEANRNRPFFLYLAHDSPHIPFAARTNRVANNSAALLHEPDTMFNLVRPGLLVYGIVPSGRRMVVDTSLQTQITPALSWKCRVAFVKEIPKGTALSYGHTFIASRKMRVATVTAGYGDGYSRAGSNHAHVLIGGVRCRVLGRVTMDQMIVDVSRVKAVNLGDEVVLIGRQGRHAISAGKVAQWCETVPWEVLTGITYRVPRLYRGGHAA